MKTFKSQMIVGGLSALVIGSLAIAANAATQAAATDPSVLVLDQKASGGELLVEHAHMPEKGYAVVYGVDKDGNPVREPLGHTELSPGIHTKFKIKLNKEPAPGTTLWVSLYKDKDGKAGFDKQADAAIWPDKLPYESRVTIQ
jgi:hypothetical protein